MGERKSLKKEKYGYKEVNNCSSEAIKNLDKKVEKNVKNVNTWVNVKVVIKVLK